MGDVLIEFDVKDLNLILGTKKEGLELYTSRKELMLNNFVMLMWLGTFVGAGTYWMMCVPFPLVLNFYLFSLEYFVV